MTPQPAMSPAERACVKFSCDVNSPHFLCMEIDIDINTAVVLQISNFFKCP